MSPINLAIALRNQALSTSSKFTDQPTSHDNCGTVKLCDWPAMVEHKKFGECYNGLVIGVVV